MQKFNQPNTINEYLDYQRKYSQEFGKENTIVFMRVGDFYEAYATFDDGFDLSIISDITNLTKTKKNKNKPICLANPMLVGFHVNSLDRYIKLLINANFTFVQVDQITLPPKPKRGVTGIHSPGTYIDIDKIYSNYIVSLYLINEKQIGINIKLKSIGLCAIDVSTGECIIYETYSNLNDKNYALDEAYRFILNYDPKEIILISNTENNVDEIISYLEIGNKKIRKIPADKNIEKYLTKTRFLVQFIHTTVEV
jgi:DNA mismatch repair ATPase MutS